jgi:hypothetical protein
MILCVSLAVVSGCTPAETQTVTVAATTVTQWTSAVTQTVTNHVTSTVTQPAVTLTTTFTEPPVTSTVTAPPVTTTIISPPVTTTVITPPVTTTVTVTSTPPVTIPVQVGIQTSVVQATTSLSAIPLVAGDNDNIVLALNITNITAQTYTGVQFGVQLILNTAASVGMPTLTPLWGTSQIWYSIDAVGKIYAFYNHPSMTIAPNSSQTIYLTLNINTAAVQTLLISSFVV